MNAPACSGRLCWIATGVLQLLLAVVTGLGAVLSGGLAVIAPMGLDSTSDPSRLMLTALFSLMALPVSCLVAVARGVTGWSLGLLLRLLDRARAAQVLLVGSVVIYALPLLNVIVIAGAFTLLSRR